MNATLKHRLIRTSGFLLFFTAISTVSQPAHTQTGGPIGIEVSQKADDFFRQGKELYKSGKLKEAHDAYQSAWALKRSYDIASNLGNTEIQLGLKRDAAEHYAFCIRNFPSSGGKAQLEHAKERFEQARKDVGALLFKVGTDGAELFVDGKSVGRSPLVEEVFVEPGERSIEAKLAGHEPARMSVRVSTGSTQTIPITLTVAAALQLPTASVVPLVSVSPSAGAPPPVVATRSAVASDAPVSGGASTPVLVTGGVVSGLAVVAGVVFTVIANGKASDAETKFGEAVKQRGPSACAQMDAIGCTDLHDTRLAQQTLGSAAAWSFIGGGVLGAVTLGYALLAPNKTSTAIMVAPVLTGSQSGLVVHGTF